MAERRKPSDLPDISHDLPSPIRFTLDRVGMSGMEFPVQFMVRGLAHTLPAKVDAYVNLSDPTAKGIHMSRLYLLVRDAVTTKPVMRPGIHSVLGDFLASHKGLSEAAKLRMNFELPLARPALVSELIGWRNYPVSIEAELKEGRLRVWLGASIMYSSTCPCSAALARQLVQERFKRDFSERKEVTSEEMSDWLKKESSIVATPHAQRSFARIVVESEGDDFIDGLIRLIDVVEKSVKTPVQAAVKREDEQEFARLNGENLMFCEDASRRIKLALEEMPGALDYRIEVEHVESLHPHSAVSMVSKGLPGGLSV